MSSPDTPSPQQPASVSHDPQPQIAQPAEASASGEAESRTPVEGQAHAAGGDADERGGHDEHSEGTPGVDASGAPRKRRRRRRKKGGAQAAPGVAGEDASPDGGAP